MMDAFTDDLKQAVLAAHEAAEEWLRSEHLLLGLVRTPSPARQVLESFGVADIAVRGRISVGTGAEFGTLPFSPGAKWALEAALQTAKQRSRSQLDTLDLLIALAREDAPSGAADVLRQLDVDLLALAARARASAT